jgi:hypothetical protein
MSKDLKEAKAAAKEQKAYYLNEQYAYHNSKILEADLILQKTNKIFELRRRHAEKIAKGKEISKAIGKNIEFWEIMAIKFQGIHNTTPEELLKIPVAKDVY